MKTTLLILLCLCAWNVNAQENGPRGLYNLTEIICRDGKKIVPNFISYKYCNDKITLQADLVSDTEFLNLTKGFRIYKNSENPIEYTGNISETENHGPQAFPIDDHSFIFRWYNSTLKNHRTYPYQQNIDEVYTSVTNDKDAIFNVFEMLNMRLGEKKSKLQGVWKLRGKQTQKRTNSQYWVEKPTKETYRIFSATRDLTIVLDSGFPTTKAQATLTYCEHLSDSAFQNFENVIPVYWFDDETISLTTSDSDGNIEVQIWDRCGLPRNAQELFDTDAPIMSKDLTPYYSSLFVEKYGEKPDSIRQAFESFSFLIQANEENNAVFPLVMEGGFETEYHELKNSLMDKLINGEINIDEAAGNYVAWFCKNFDRHTRLPSSLTFKKLEKDFQIYYHNIIKEYAPQPIACKVDDKTFLVRIPSCEGKYPTLEWIEEKVKEYKDSGCPYLILDVRGNGGGSDHIGSPFYTLLGDCGSKEKERILFRNSYSNRQNLYQSIKALQILGMEEFIDEIQERIERAELSPRSTYTDWVHYDKGEDPYTPGVKKGAVIMDALTASSGESFVSFVKYHSQTHAKVYAKDNSCGADKTGNCTVIKLPYSDIWFVYPTTADESIKETCKSRKPGWSPDVVIPLPYPEKLTDNIDEWVLWVAKDMKKR